MLGEEKRHLVEMENPIQNDQKPDTARKSYWELWAEVF